MTEQPTKKEYNRKRNNQIVIRFSDEELIELNEKISQSKLNKTDFFLQVLRRGNVIVYSELQDICAELKKQGINLNQALRHYHETGFDEELKTAIQNCNDVYEEFKNLFIETDSILQKKKHAGQQKKRIGDGDEPCQ